MKRPVDEKSLSTKRLSTKRLSTKRPVDQMSVDQMSVDQMSVDETSVDETSEYGVFIFSSQIITREPKSAFFFSSLFIWHDFSSAVSE